MPAIVLDNLHFAYPPLIEGGLPVQVLRGLSLRLPAGQALAIIGPTSSGKSTLALILAGLAPEMTGGQLRGRASIDGLDTATTPAAQLSVRLGLVFQEPERQLFNMTVADEVAFGLESRGLPPAEIGPRMAWALDSVGLEGLEERAPWQLSGGQQKRLAIATVLAMRPPILVLDEPMAGLDPLGRREVAALLADLKANSGATVLVIDKDAEFVARWAERVVVLAGGQFVLDGSPAGVFQQVQRLRELGVAVPQVAELAGRLELAGPAGQFLTARQAADSLRPLLELARPAQSARHATGDQEGRQSISSPAETDPAPSSSPAVDLQQLRFAYEGGAQALDGVDLRIPRGQFLAIVGPNGGGKSTLARHLNGLLRPQAGSVAILGRPAQDQSVGELARQVGYVFQNPDQQIFAPSVREEVAYGPQNLGLRGDKLAERVAEALAAFGLAELADMPPAVLGYGLRRLVTIASVWAMQPAIWVLDEPTTGLDAHYTGLLLDRLRHLHQAGRTILLITHDLRLVAAAAQRVIVLHQGRVALDGSPTTVLADGERLAAFGLRPPPIVRLSALLAPAGFPHPTLTVDAFVQAWKAYRTDSPGPSLEQI